MSLEFKNAFIDMLSSFIEFFQTTFNIDEVILLKMFIEFKAKDEHIKTIMEGMKSEKQKIVEKNFEYLRHHKGLNTWLSKFISPERLEELVQNLWYASPNNVRQDLWTWLNYLASKAK